MTAVMHALTVPEAHAVSVVLAAVEHIPVTAAVDSGTVHVRPGRELSTAEKVTTLRAFRAVSDSPFVWAGAWA